MGLLTRRAVGVLAALLLCTMMLLVFHVPMRIAFAMSRSSFELHLPVAVLPTSSTAPLRLQVGLYSTDDVLADSRGGVYFCVRRIGGFMSHECHGFVHKPNQEGTPFGSLLALHGLGNDWYWFEASDKS